MQDDLNLLILHMFEDTFSLDVVHIVKCRFFKINHIFLDRESRFSTKDVDIFFFFFFFLKTICHWYSLEAPWLSTANEYPCPTTYIFLKK